MQPLLIALLVATLILGPEPGPSRRPRVRAGAVAQLARAPHRFIADEQGVLHRGGDTRALAGRFIGWSNRCDLRPESPRAMQRGDKGRYGWRMQDGAHRTRHP